MLSIKAFAQRYAFPLWKWYLVGTVFLAATNLITLEIPQLAKQIINGIEANEYSQLSIWALLIILLGVLQMICRSLSRVLIFWPGRKLEATSKIDLFTKTLKTKFSFIDSFGMGDLVSRLSNDLSQIRVFYSFAVLQVLNLIFLASFTVYKMISVHPTLTALCLIPIGVMLTLTYFFMPRLAQYSRKTQEELGLLTNQVTEAFGNVHIIQGHSTESIFSKRIEAKNESVYRANMRLVSFRTLFFPLLSNLTGVSQMLVLAYGGQQVLVSKLTLGDLLAFNVYLSYLAFPMTSIGIVMSIYQRSKTALERVSILDQEPIEKALIEQELPKSEEDYIINIKCLNFRFPKQSEDTLKNINLKINKGEKVGICGRVASGKTTLFNLITRIHTPPEGSIFIRGKDILSMEPHELRESVGYCLQTPQLFSDSIKNNLLLGSNEEIADDKLFSVAKGSQIISDIQSLPLSWKTQIGEKGVRLSGGQKQRLALSRIFLKDYQLILLDDVLSAVDNHTEVAIIDHLRSLESSIIISSHRTSVLQACDRVLFLDQGAIVDEGPFDQLAAKYPSIRESSSD